MKIKTLEAIFTTLVEESSVTDVLQAIANVINHNDGLLDLEEIEFKDLEDCFQECIELSKRG